MSAAEVLGGKFHHHRMWAGFTGVEDAQPAVGLEGINVYGQMARFRAGMEFFEGFRFDPGLGHIDDELEAGRERVGAFHYGEEGLDALGRHTSPGFNPGPGAIKIDTYQNTELVVHIVSSVRGRPRRCGHPHPKREL